LKAINLLRTLSRLPREMIIDGAEQVSAIAMSLRKQDHYGKRYLAHELLKAVPQAALAVHATGLAKDLSGSGQRHADMAFEIFSTLPADVMGREEVLVVLSSNYVNLDCIATSNAAKALRLVDPTLLFGHIKHSQDSMKIAALHAMQARQPSLLKSHVLCTLLFDPTRRRKLRRFALEAIKQILPRHELEEILLRVAGERDCCNLRVHALAAVLECVSAGPTTASRFGAELLPGLLAVLLSKEVLQLDDGPLEFVVKILDALRKWAPRQSIDAQMLLHSEVMIEQMVNASNNKESAQKAERMMCMLCMLLHATPENWHAAFVDAVIQTVGGLIHNYKVNPQHLQSFTENLTERCPHAYQMFCKLARPLTQALADTSEDVRCKALGALEGLPLALLAPHAAALCQTVNTASTSTELLPAIRLLYRLNEETLVSPSLIARCDDSLGACMRHTAHVEVREKAEALSESLYRPGGEMQLRASRMWGEMALQSQASVPHLERA